MNALHGYFAALFLWPNNKYHPKPYVWDEPLNFVDVYSRMQIEQLIAEFSPTMLLVEHDLAFRDTVATRVVHLQRQ